MSTEPRLRGDRSLSRLWAEFVEADALFDKLSGLNDYIESYHEHNLVPDFSGLSSEARLSFQENDKVLTWTIKAL